MQIVDAPFLPMNGIARSVLAVTTIRHFDKSKRSGPHGLTPHVLKLAKPGEEHCAPFWWTTELVLYVLQHPDHASRNFLPSSSHENGARTSSNACLALLVGGI